MRQSTSLLGLGLVAAAVGLAVAQDPTTPYDPKKDPLVNPATLLQAHDPATCGEDETLFARVDGNPKNLNALFQSSTVEFRLCSALYDGPFTFDAKMEWRTNDYFTERLEISPDQKTWTLTLRPGLTWHDGHPFTSHDIVFSWKTILDERVPCPAQKPGTDEIADCVALDDRTVKFVHKEPLPTSKWNVMFSIIPKHLYEPGMAEDPTLLNSDRFSRLNRAPVGNGPYRFVEWVADDKIVVERWDAFPGPKPHFKRIVFRIVPQQNVALLRFENGEFDEMVLTSPQFAVDSVKSEKFRQVGVKALATEWAYGYLGWNMDSSVPYFQDVRVRRAMTHAVDIPRIIARILYGLPQPCHGIFHPTAWMYNPEIKLLAYDLDQAGALLDAAGWAANDDDGWRYKGGRKFSFELLMGQGNPTGEEIAALIQEDLKSIGVDMQIRTMEWATMQEKVRKHEFQAMFASWGTGTDPDTNWNLWVTGEKDTGRNYVCYSNKRVDELFALGRKEFDQAKRKRIYQEIQKLVYDDQPYTFLWNVPTRHAFHKRLRGIAFSPRGVINFDPGDKAWWVHKAEQLRAGN